MKQTIQGVYADIPELRNIAKRFSTFGTILNGMSKTFEVIASILKATAFIGLIGASVHLYIVQKTIPEIQELATRCKQLSTDLNASINAYERGDSQGITRFY